MGQALCAWKTVDRITKSTPQSFATTLMTLTRLDAVNRKLENPFVPVKRQR